MTDTDALIARPEDWPHGLRCMDCGRDLGGESYVERLEGFVGDSLITEIVCPSCESKSA